MKKKPQLQVKVIRLLTALCISSGAAWIFLACVLQIATSRAGMVTLEIIMFLGLGAWVLQNYLKRDKEVAG